MVHFSTKTIELLSHAYINVLFTLGLISIHESNDEFPSDCNGRSVPLDVSPRGQALPVSSYHTRCCSHDQVLLTGNVLPVTRCNCGY